MLFEHSNGQRQRQYLSAEDGEPDAVYAEQGRQDEHRNGFKHQGAYCGDDSRDFAVVQSREERGGVEVETYQEIGKAVDTECLTGKGVKLRIVAHEDFGERRNGQFQQ